MVFKWFKENQKDMAVQIRLKPSKNGKTPSAVQLAILTTIAELGIQSRPKLMEDSKRAKGGYTADELLVYSGAHRNGRTFFGYDYTRPGRDVVGANPQSLFVLIQMGYLDYLADYYVLTSLVEMVPTVAEE